jgi:hypothetical protein
MDELIQFRKKKQKQTRVRVLKVHVICKVSANIRTIFLRKG